ncbi:C40 family peptidase [Thermoactinospora rubra]|uniref:C40 family peptidase n=1 Tax=Thermoactinospora rubra TaxID=1088767 RepID=UPI001301AD14|nr:C40 family peptidase [Thermoactinospora rubra]
MSATAFTTIALSLTPAPAQAASDPSVLTLTGAELQQIRTKPTRTPAWKVALDYALDKRGTPYVYGGASERGYDCSGLMLRAYESAGIRLPRTAAQQYHAFSRKIAWDDLRPGDLVFFSNLGHVGMISRPGYMVHSPRTGEVVKEEKLSAWRRRAFVGAVRPDPQGVARWIRLVKERQEPPPAMPVATAL